MAYVKQTWNPYDENKSEQENIENGAVGTSQRLNHMEEGISSAAAKADDNGTGLSAHAANKSNPHGVTKSQVGLGNVDNVKQTPLTDFTAHTQNNSNPHKVTANQVGAYSKAEADNKYLLKTDAVTQLEQAWCRDPTTGEGFTKLFRENLALGKNNSISRNSPQVTAYTSVPVHSNIVDLVRGKTVFISMDYEVRNSTAIPDAGSRRLIYEISFSRTDGTKAYYGVQIQFADGTTASGRRVAKLNIADDIVSYSAGALNLQVGGSFVYIGNPKIEVVQPGEPEIETPFMPSSISDPDNAYYPYVGFANTDSNNYQDYKWEPNPELPIRQAWCSDVTTGEDFTTVKPVNVIPITENWTTINIAGFSSANTAAKVQDGFIVFNNRTNTSQSRIFWDLNAYGVTKVPLVTYLITVKSSENCVVTFGSGASTTKVSVDTDFKTITVFSSPKNSTSISFYTTGLDPSIVFTVKNVGVYFQDVEQTFYVPSVNTDPVNAHLPFTGFANKKTEIWTFYKWIANPDRLQVQIDLLQTSNINARLLALETKLQIGE